MESHDKVLGFQFEPVRSTPTEPDYVDCSDEDVPNQTRMGQNVTDWCSCGNCQNMPTAIECVCCLELQEIQSYQSNAPSCIVNNEEFQPVVLQKGTLWTALVALHDREGKSLKKRKDLCNRTLRYAAYRQFCWWIHARLGKGVRKVIPSCVVSKIREVYPSENGAYTGFQESEGSEIQFSWVGD